MKNYSVSVIVPARDEAGTIRRLIKEIPKMGKGTEIIFVEGFSKDSTWKTILREKNPNVRAFKEVGKKGKAGATFKGFKEAKGDILMVLDADLSVDPKVLPKIYKLLISKKVDFVNCSRFVYPKEKGAMRYFNHLGNKFFAFIFSLILKQKITDTLCGTKALWKKDYEKMALLTRRIKKSDPYGDFTLLMGAGKLRLKVAEVPVRYKARVYGKSKISPFWDGIKLIKLLIFQILGV